MDIRADIEGVAPLERLLADMMRHAGDLTDLFDLLGQVIETQTDERFDSETAPDGSRWAPSWRAREEGGKTLTKSGRGRNSLTHRAFSDRVELGSNVRYMAAHQTGATIRPRTAPALAFMLPGMGLVFAKKVELPKREWIGLSSENGEELVEEAEDWFLSMFPEMER